MIGARREPRRPLVIQLLRLQYWYDRQSELRRLLVGLCSILFLAACLLYVLGFTSTILVSRMDLSDASVPPRPEVAPGTVAAQPVATPRPGQPTPLPPTPTATPATDSGGALIPPPDVPEVAIIPAPPRIADPQPVKPRVVATPAGPIRTPLPTAVGTRPTVVGTPGTPLPTPLRTAAPATGATPANGTLARTPTPTAPQAAPTRTLLPMPTAPRTSTPPPLPTIPARPTAQLAQPTPTRPRP